MEINETKLKETIIAIHDTPRQVVIEFAGAGSQALAWLHSVGGSSRTLLEATDRYAPASLIETIGFEPTQFTGPEVAQALAAAAYRRARHLAGAESAVAGIGCTATIATDRAKRGQHRACLAVRDGQQVITYEVTLQKGERERQEEEAIVSRLLIRAVAEACGVEATPDLPLLATEVVTRQVEPVTPLRRLLAGEVEWVKIDPTGQMTAGETLPHIAFLSGAFNPLHEGHRGMVAVAAERLQRAVYFELPIINADKAPISLSEAQRRAAQFEGWATLLLSRAPLFSQKARMFPGSVFILGIDTARRILQLRFYNDDPAQRRAAFETIREAGCRFLVAGRLVEGQFLSLADLAIPPGYEDLFEAIPETAFRVDVSSTEIRERGS